MNNLRYVASGTERVALHVYLVSKTTGEPIEIEHTATDLEIIAHRVGDGAGNIKTYAGTSIQTISTIGERIPPDTGKVRFSPIKSPDIPGWHEVVFENDLFADGDGPVALKGVIRADAIRTEPFYVQMASMPTDVRSIAGWGTNSLPQPEGAISTWSFMQWMGYFARFLTNKMTINKSNATMVVYKDDNTSVITTQAVSDDGTVQTRGRAS